MFRVPAIDTGGSQADDRVMSLWSASMDADHISKSL